MHAPNALNVVMPGFKPGIHVLRLDKAWMARDKPGHDELSDGCNGGEMLKFTKDHEWLRIEGDVATVGITPYAQEQLGDLVFVEVPVAGRAVERGAAAAVVESVKAASDVYAPISGEVIEGNAEIVKEPSLVNSDPMGRGWLFKLRIKDAAEIETLMNEDGYQELIG